MKRHNGVDAGAVNAPKKSRLMQDTPTNNLTNPLLTDMYQVAPQHVSSCER